MYKFRPITDRYNAVASSIEPDEHCSADENTIPYKGKKSKLWQYNPKKPKEWGCKLYMLCKGQNGVILKTDLYTGKGQNKEKEDIGLIKSSRVVWELTQTLLEGRKLN